MVPLSSRICQIIKMPNATKSSSAQLDYTFLLVAHIVCAEKQIHCQTAQALQEIATQTEVGDDTIAQMEKILTQDENRLSVEEVASRIPPDKQNEAMDQILALAHLDGLFSPLERDMVEKVAQIWHWRMEEIQEKIVAASRKSVNSATNDERDNAKLSLAAMLLKGAESILSRALVTKLAELAPESVGVQIAKLQREILLSGLEYENAVRQCSAIALEDYKLAEVALEEAGTTLANLGKSIETALRDIQDKASLTSQSPTTKEVIRQLETTKQALSQEVGKEIEIIRNSLFAKQRAVNYFSIAFIGKTKVGKSTLHGIITGSGWEGIGTGGQRTTRYNRVYEWKNIRIIDTPGIGAPGGKTDEEIVQSTIEESDIICYIVTNDSIQETEFEFLRQLKAQAKPLIILLNIKHNLRDPRRLDNFLQNPGKLFAMEGNSGIGGHIERIRRYAKEHYANDYFEIIPVMLLAALMARETEHAANKDKLFQASRIEDFLDAIRESLVKHGTIRRSQTLLGSTVGAIEHPQKWASQHLQVYQQLIDTLKTQRQHLYGKIQVAGKDSWESLQQQILAIFQDLLNSLPYFAEDNWNFTEESLRRNWQRKLQSMQFEQRIYHAYSQSVQKFDIEVKQALAEVGNELNIISKLTGLKFSLTDDNSSLYNQDFDEIGTTLLKLSQTVVTTFTPPVNKTIMMTAFLINSIISVSKTREEKRTFALERISKLLLPQIQQTQATILEKARLNFGNYYREAAISSNNYFEIIIQGLEALIPQFVTPQKKLETIAYSLNLFYSKRIVDWCLGKSEPLTESAINKTITKIKRDFASRIDIETKFEISSKIPQTEINLILQEEVSLHRIK